uniref:BTB domain-containing protein n=1 Tax=Panagrolaimus superbus TaxID=310955 RepID=A0A914ZA04_9BILA
MSSYLDSDEVYIRNDDDLSESLRAMQNERLEIFTQQNLEEGLFDIAFEVEGKTLHAHKFIIASISETMKCWLSDRWTAKDEVIKIENYSYDEFYEFLTFLYSSQCKLTKENIVKMTDMAEFYGVQCLKDFCDEFLTAMKKSVETIEELFVFAQTYSLPKLESSLESFFWSNYEKLCKSDAFISFKKPFVEFLCAVDFIYRCKKEILFESVYKWAEHRILKDKSVDGDESFNLLEAVKAELSTFLSHFYFPKMDFNFLMDFVGMLFYFPYLYI